VPRTGLDDVTVVYAGDGGTALDHLSLMAEQGEILAVLGPSGSGKSTLLRAMAGLVPLAGGDIYIADRRVTDLPPHERRLAMVFEAAAVLPFINVSGNLGWGLKTRHVPGPESERRVQSQARGLGLSRFLPRMPDTLSAGEYARVGIGRALVHEPSAFLLDEPLAHLDAGQRVEVRRRIVEVVRPLDVSTFYVTHDQAEAMAVADRVALLQDGRIVQVARPRDLYDRPATLFAASFVGEPAIGVVRARPVVSGGSAGFRVGARVLPLWQPLPPELAAYVDREVLLGVRPEDVHDATEGIDPNAVSLPAEVVEVEQTGPDTVVTYELVAPGEDGGQAARLHARRSRDSDVRRGDTVPIAIDVLRVHVFDAATGAALWHPTP
jgi:multiple sugar transport system ATP-binding protein